jgi:hypothetical protein
MSAKILATGDFHLACTAYLTVDAEKFGPVHLVVNNAALQGRG